MVDRSGVRSDLSPSAVALHSQTPAQFCRKVSDPGGVVGRNLLVNEELDGEARQMAGRRAWSPYREFPGTGRRADRRPPARLPSPVNYASAGVHRRYDVQVTSGSSARVPPPGKLPVVSQVSDRHRLAAKRCRRSGRVGCCSVGVVTRVTADGTSCGWRPRWFNRMTERSCTDRQDC